MMNANAVFSVLKATPFPMLVVSADYPHFTIAAANTAFLKNSNSHENEIIGKSIFSAFSPVLKDKNQENADLRKSLEKVLSSKLPDKILVNKNLGCLANNYKHGKRYYECESTPVLSETGEIEYIIHTSIDVTEKENAVRQLKDNEIKLKAAEQIAKIGYWKADLVGNEVFWSEEAHNLVGIKPGSVLDYELFFHAIHPDDREMFETERLAVLAGEKDMDIEFRVVQDGGIQKWMHGFGKLVKNNKGETIAFEGTIQDITSSKLLKLALEESNMRYKYATQATFDAVYDWDYINDTCYWGEGFIRGFGYDAKTLADKDFWKNHVHPEDHDRIMNEIHLIAKGSASKWINEYRFRKMDGSYASVLDRSIIIRDKNGRATRMIGAVQDVSEKKNLLRLLDKANRLAHIGSWEIDVENGTVYWSKITKEIRETPENFEPTLREGISYFKEGYSKDTIIARVKDAAKYGTPWQEDLQIYTHKGNLKWVRTIGEAEIIDGKCKKIYGSFQDIDETKKAELEILKLYEEKKTILESIGDGFFRVDNDWVVKYWNKEAEKMLAIPRNETLGQNIWDVFPDAIGTALYDKFHGLLESKNRAILEYFYTGLKRWFEISAYPTDGGLSVYFRDITDRKLTHIQLAESEKRYSELFRLNPQPIWVFEPDTYRFVQVNKAAIDLYGYSEEEFLNMTVLAIRPPQEVSKARKALEKYYGKENFVSGQFKHQTKSGEIIEVEVQSNFVMMNEKKYHLAIITDVTEKNRMEQQVDKAIIKTQENERYEIGAELHDNICQILASTYITLGVLSKSVNPSGKELFNKSREYISLATREIRNLSHTLAPAFFNNTKLEEAFELLLNSTNIEKKYSVSLYFDKAVEKLNMGRDLQLNLYRILQEQLRNIHKYACCQRIEVDLIVRNNKIKMRIADNGVGFDINAVKGGIGISNMRRRVKLYNGELEIFTAPGEGCELNIEIPLDVEKPLKYITPDLTLTQLS
ncbi:MAG: PAS domain S-box protein [Ginsengibacter sp.]